MNLNYRNEIGPENEMGQKQPVWKAGGGWVDETRRGAGADPGRGLVGRQQLGMGAHGQGPTLRGRMIHWPLFFSPFISEA